MDVSRYCVLLSIECLDARLDIVPWRGAIVDILIEHIQKLVRWRQVPDVAPEALVLYVERCS
jgi:hypothetical protein